MRFERYTDRAHKVLALAKQVADFAGDNYVGTEHVLYGLLKEGEGSGVKELIAKGFPLGTMRDELQIMFSERKAAQLRTLKDGQPVTREVIETIWAAINDLQNRVGEAK
jgi:ATP-dependent Clp protease ATP-binding subunit ClpC